MDRILLWPLVVLLVVVVMWSAAVIYRGHVARAAQLEACERQARVRVPDVVPYWWCEE